MKKIFNLILFLLLFSSGIFAQQKVLLTDFGVKPDCLEDAATAIRKAIDLCKTLNNVSLVLPEGRIDVWPKNAEHREFYISNCTEDDTLSKDKNIAFLMENVKNITIEGSNTLIVLHGKMIAFAFINCENIQLKNISFDYERPTMSELCITDVSENAIEADIHPDSRFSIVNGKISFYGEGWKLNAWHTILYSPKQEVMKYSSFRPFIDSRATETSPLHLKFEGKFSTNDYQAGDVLTIRDPYRDNCGAFINLSMNIRLENINMYYMHGLGIVSQFSENISLLKVNVAPRKNSGRYIATFADCFHFSGCKGRILIDSCVCIGSHDDPVNVHGTHLQIMEIKNDKKIIVRFMHHQTYGFPAFFVGDSIAFINSQTLMPLGYAKLKFAALINKREMEVETDGNLPDNIKTGYCIENISWAPEVCIKNSRFERGNTRGLLLTSRRKILIENNSFYRMGMHAILIADDASSWYESGAVQDVLIRNNKFMECGYNSAPDNYIIAIAPENHELQPKSMVHQNIRIEGNTFYIYDYPLISVRSTSNITFNDNTVIWITTFLKAKQNEAASFKFTACENVKLLRNKFKFSFKPSILIEKMKKKELKTDIGKIEKM
ncbi:MAG: right-handed parallel beta-helix repeat-containing protein [Bacteroidetes bacterium]|nr:right-handed parallel beta-helix repeat-containing protein [Bacteroidota bacterium]